MGVTFKPELLHLIQSVSVLEGIITGLMASFDSNEQAIKILELASNELAKINNILAMNKDYVVITEDIPEEPEPQPPEE